ncbi:MAG: cysteine hydrolase [Lachnospiraceae bacterium]|nr:cysteine hydrolase [Lachnospiraceae bacterium]
MKILVVVDMQNDFIDGALGTKEAVAIVDKVADKIRNYPGKIIFTRDTHFDNYAETQEGKNLPVLHCVENTFGWQISDKLPMPDDAVIFDKPTFGSKNLAEYLVKENDREPIEEIEFIGLCTDICVISNAFVTKAFLPEIPLVADASCCAGVTPESHLNALSAMEMCQVKIINK